MKKDFNTGLRKGIEADRVKLTRRRKLLLREMGGQPHTMASQHYRSHAKTDLLGIMIIQPGHLVVLCAGNRKDAGHPGRKKKCEACSFHLCYYQLEPVGSITSRQAYGAGMPAILIICRW